MRASRDTTVLRDIREHHVRSHVPSKFHVEHWVNETKVNVLLLAITNK